MENLKVVAKLLDCSGSGCPTVFVDDNSNYYFQGKRLSASDKIKFVMLDDEEIVSLPNELVEKFIQSVKK